MSTLPTGLHVKKVGNTVEVSGRMTLAKGADDWIPLFVLPNGYRPEATIVCGLESETGVLEVWIEPDGSVTADQPRPGWIEFTETSYEAA